MNKKKLILIAEDDISIRTVLSTELENKFDLKLTDNCAQLWNWVSDGLGDLIILDVMMPDENGLELIPKIKEIRPDVKIIVIIFTIFRKIFSFRPNNYYFGVFFKIFF